MNWLLRALGLAREPDLTDDQRLALAEARRRESRAGMGLEVLRGMSPGKAAKKYGCAYGTALRAAKRELERTPGYDTRAFLEFCNMPGKRWFSRARNLSEYYAVLTAKRVRS
ncbi:MAG: hypothetical protein RJA36_3568 [Pseudomonadota bacterium]|jgi:hypothetical protein